MSIPRYNFFTSFGYVINISGLEKRGDFRFIQGRIKIPMWDGNDIFLNISTTQDTATRLSKILFKGTEGMFSGKLVTNEFDGTDGKKKYVLEYKIEDFRVMKLKDDKTIPYYNKFVGLCNFVSDGKVTYKKRKSDNEEFPVLTGRVSVNTLSKKNTLFTQVYYTGEQAKSISKYLKKGTGCLIEGNLVSIASNNKDYTYLNLSNLQLVYSPDKVHVKGTTEKKGEPKNFKFGSSVLKIEDFKPKKGFKPIF